VGRTTYITLEHAGGLGILFGQIVVAIVSLKVSIRSVLNQMYIMGIQSLPIVLVTGSLAGIVTSQQGGYQMTSAVPDYVLGSLVVETVVLEMGPVLTALVLVGRIGARITAELGTMVVSEQIDAFKSLGRDPVAILAAPRVIAGVLVLPLLVGIADLIGILAGVQAAFRRQISPSASGRSRFTLAPGSSGTAGTSRTRRPRRSSSASRSLSSRYTWA